MKKLSIVFAAIVVTFLAVNAPAFAQFDVDWGTSNDTGNSGFTDLNNWFSSNGYGSINAQTDYIGHNAADSDPFLFASGHTTFEVVSRLAGNANLTSFGYYTGSVGGKVLTEVLGAGVNGPATVNTPGSFGVYLSAPQYYQAGPLLNWYSSRGENAYDQNGASHTNPGGDPQALIYKLNPSSYLLAWEDLDYSGIGGTDRDFNDAYLKITTTPEPISMALFGLGGGVMAAAGYRKRRKK